MQLLVLIVGGVVVGVATSILLDRMGWSAKAKAQSAEHEQREAEAFAAGSALVDEVAVGHDLPTAAPPAPTAPTAGDAGPAASAAATTAQGGPIVEPAIEPAADPAVEPTPAEPPPAEGSPGATAGQQGASG